MTYRPRHARNRDLKLRFLLLQEAGFKCQYCGRPAPEVRLQIDHRIPVCCGGSDEPSNMVVACSDCNNGKQDIILRSDWDAKHPWVGYPHSVNLCHLNRPDLRPGLPNAMSELNS